MSNPRSMQSSRKGMKVLGVTAAQLIGKVLDGDARLGAGALDRDEFALFWAGLADDSTEFLIVCIRTLQEAIDGRRVLSFPWHALVNTIAFLVFRFRIRDNTPLLRQTLTEVKNARYDRGVFSAADDVLRTVYKRLVEGDQALDTLLIQMSTLYSAAELTTLADHLHYPTLDGNKVSGGELAFVYHYLRDTAADDAIVCATILDRAMALLAALPQTLKINTILAETKLLAVLHLVSEIVIRRPKVIDPLITRMSSALQPFLLWPSPISNCVQRTLFLIQRESRFTGVNLLERILDESHGAVLSVDLATGDGVDVAAIPIFYIMDGASLACSQAYKVLGLSDMDVDDQLGRYGALAPDLNAEVKAHLVTSLLQVGNAEKLRADPDLDNLFADVIGIVRDAVGRLDDDVDERLSALSKRVGGGRCQPDWPSLAPFQHIACVDTIWYRMGPKTAPSRSFPITPMHERLRRIVQHMAAAASRGAIRPVAVHLVCCGSDRVLHALACAYLSQRLNDPDSFRDLDFRFYVVPIDDNLQASYLARHDACYHRHIYQPFRARPFLLPYLSSTEIDFPPRRSTGAECAMPPGLYLRDAVEMFVRESFDVVPVQVYQIECWGSRDTSCTPDHMVPLLARLEISVRVEARYYQKSQQDPRKLSEIVKSVGLPQPQLMLQYAKMNVFGACTTTVSLESIIYDGVVLANIPITKDPCFPANPTEKYLEMYAQSHGASIGSATVSAPSRKTKSGANYGELRCRVGMVDVTASETPFSVLVDNSLFGPFFRIVVSANNVTLPFRSMFPISS